ncbi:MAG: hydrolase [Clostridiales bacterium]|nr:hydrolase [Clostridiales bacterium]
MRILSEDTIAIAVDYQTKILPAMSGIDALIHRSSILLKGLKLLDVPVILTRQYPKGLGDTVPEIQAVTEGCPVLDKMTFSCYDTPAVREALEASGKKTVIVFGIEAHVCVLQTVIDLLDDGYQAVLVEDCISSRNPSDMAAALIRAQQEGARITTCEALLFELTRVSGTPVFKEISKLVK